MGRRPCCAKVGMNKGSWSAPEDEILIDYIKVHGEGKWRDLPRRAGLKRCGKSCRLRWLNYLRSDIIRGNITDEEEELIVKLHKLLGNRWSLIAGRLPGRTDNEVKNYWNTNLSKRDQPKPSQNPKQDRQKQENTQDLKKPSIVANVEPIRPRAVRCTKVVISQITEVQTKSTNEFVPHHQQWDSIIASDEKGLQNENSRDCLLDFDIDDFLLDPLNGDLYVNSEVEGEDYSLKEMPFYPDFPGLDELGDDQLKEIEDLDFRNLETFLNSEEAQENTQDLKKPSIVATVEPIRPRARRCTKVVIPQITEIQTKSTNEFVPHHQQWDSIIVSDEKVLQNENSMDCLLDFEINDFMLDALNGDLYVNLEVEGEDYNLKEMPFYPDFPGLDDLGDDQLKESEDLDFRNLETFYS